MKRSIIHTEIKIPPIHPKIFGLLKSGYNRQSLQKDIIAGVTMGIVALPLALAFAIASGVPPEKGLLTAIVAGFFMSFFSGSRCQVGGPTGAFVVIIYGIVAMHGYSGLVMATLMAGVILLFFGLSRMGSYIKFIPFPVTTGFTAGMGVVMMSTEVRDFFGFTVENLSPDFIEKTLQYINVADTINIYATTISVVSVLLIILIRRKIKKIPSYIFAILFTTLAVYFFNIPVETIGSKFGDIPNTVPMPSIPDITWRQFRQLIPVAFTIAILVSIESLLSAVVTDGMTGDRHDSNTELVAQAVGNFFSGIFGGMPAAGAMARTVTNVKLGAQSPISGIVHSLVLLLIFLFFSSAVEKIPMAAIAGVLAVVSWDMINPKELKYLSKAPKSDFIMMLVVLVLTVLVDITVAVEVGVLMAALMFMKRMSDVTSIETVVDGSGKGGLYKDSDPDSIDNKNVPQGVSVYEINGPFFFGIADKFIQTLDSINKMPKVFILRIRKVPTIDSTGMHALRNFYDICCKKGVTLILSGVQSHGHTRRIMHNDGFIDLIGKENVVKNIDLALERADEVLESVVDPNKECEQL